ncbi:guanylate kinase [Ornithobacterium rhinotracheale]|uniref:guanylate kinase n=1 Tax=Ornithobacterium rhinotracheale TaxID=28251 RepID=UPI00129CD424|nr:guanylate kinase [Ornithobacterium rhinotracheale]MRI62697.1 guanylate kinase [Ornithobacterium rhinotracheale]
MNSGKLIIFSAPSGAGKTTLVKHLLKTRNDLAFSISCATRAPRKGEVDGVDYYFLTPEEFKQKVANNEFVEWEEVYENHCYGTLKSEIERIWNAGKNVVFDIDVQGGINLKKQFGGKALSIFVQPPSVETLAQRLRDRNTDSPEKLEMRIAKATKELEFAKDFDTILVNDDLEVAKKEVNEIVENFISK